MPITIKQLSGGAVISVGTLTPLHKSPPNHKDQLYLEVSNITSAPATISIIMGGQHICKDVMVDANSPPSTLVKNLISFDEVFADSNVLDAVVITGYAKRRIR